MKKALVLGILVGLTLMGSGCGGQKARIEEKPAEEQTPRPDLKDSAAELQKIKASQQ